MFLEQAQHTKYVLYLCDSRNQDHAMLHSWLINLPQGSKKAARDVCGSERKGDKGGAAAECMGSSWGGVQKKGHKKR